MPVYFTEDSGDTQKYHFRRIQASTIRFRVKAEHDVAICLSPNDKEEPEDMYEILIGCWGGGESGIRRKNHDDVCRVETLDIVSGDEFRTFWIKIKKGIIKVGHSGEKHPFMSYSDPETLSHATWYGYSTGCGAEGEWMFLDDDDDDDTDASDSDSDDADDNTVNAAAADDDPVTADDPVTVTFNVTLRLDDN